MCPNGVEFKTLGEVATLSRGKVYSKEYLRDNAGEYPVYSSQTANNGELGRISTYDYDGKYLTWTTDGAYAGTVFRREGRFSITNVCGLISNVDKALSIDFLYYWLNKVAKGYVYQGMGNPKLMSNVMETIEIPLPPIEIQKKIVECLDKFSALAAELQAELHLRRKQYEYYRTQLLTPHSDCNSADNTDDAQWEWKKITDIADTFIGLATSVTKYKKPQGVLLLHNSDIKDGRIELKSIEYLDTDFVLKNASKILHTDDIITVHTGDVGTSAVITPEYEGTIGFTTITSRIKDKTIITPAFFCKFLNSAACKDAIVSKTISDRNNLNLASFDELRIPIPTIKEQQRIVDILDKFEMLTTSLSDGIPAEQAAQQKRYEYYRDLLLTFDRKAE